MNVTVMSAAQRFEHWLSSVEVKALVALEFKAQQSISRDFTRIFIFNVILHSFEVHRTLRC